MNPKRPLSTPQIQFLRPYEAEACTLSLSSSFAELVAGSVLPDVAAVEEASEAAVSPTESPTPELADGSAPAFCAGSCAVWLPSSGSPTSVTALPIEFPALEPCVPPNTLCARLRFRT